MLYSRLLSAATSEGVSSIASRMSSIPQYAPSAQYAPSTEYGESAPSAQYAPPISEYAPPVDHGSPSSEQFLPSGWELHISPEGQQFYHNSETGETSWHFPTGQAPSAQVPAATVPAALMPVPARDVSAHVSEHSRWTTLSDENGNPYYYNEDTKESRWDMPNEPGLETQSTQLNAPNEYRGSGPQPPSNPPSGPPGWDVLKSPEGVIYFRNIETNRVQWERPLGGQIGSSSQADIPSSQGKEESAVAQAALKGVKMAAKGIRGTTVVGSKVARAMTYM